MIISYIVRDKIDSIYDVSLDNIKSGTIVSFIDWPYVYQITKSHGLKLVSTYRCFKKGYS